MLFRLIKPLLLALAVVGALGAAGTPAAAQSLDELRASGAVGERFDGLLVARNAAAKGDVAKINAKRQKIYGERAKAQGVAPDQVGRVFAKKIFGQAAKGTWFLQENGKWVQK
jgi:uncharacterized protein YdbL (DUF1318 family)